MSIHKKWICNDCDNDLVNSISYKFNISHIVAKILVNRGITDDDKISDFLFVDENQFLDPYLLSGMKQCVDRIKIAVENNDKIAVYGDYDVDGITSTYIVYDYLKSIGASVIYYIPDRASEGYGLNMSAIDSLAEQDIGLIITVDVGITAIDEVIYASSRGIDVIVTDHHTPGDSLPPAFCVINPKLQDNIYPNSNLAGVGVAFKLVYALADCDKKIIDKYCQFACIGTIADMVPLIGENRFIASYGLEKIKETKNIGLKALLDVSGIDRTLISSSNISFAVAPRLNAAGRISSAENSVKLFLCQSEDEAINIAKELDAGNKLRQNTEQEIIEEALNMIYANKLYDDNVIVVAKEDWHHGVIGIVASKITEKFYKPCTVISLSPDGTGKASGRSISGFNLFDALSACDDVLIKFGGHELAAGFSLSTDNVELFRQRINQYADSILNEDILTPVLNIDAEIGSKELTLKTAYELKILEPHGIGNRSPVLCVKNASVSNVKLHKGGKHAFITFEKGRSTFTSPAFNMADKLSVFSGGDVLNLAGTLGVNNYRGVENMQFITRDILPDSASDLNIENMRCIFVMLKEYIKAGRLIFKLDDLSHDLKNKYLRRFGKNRLKLSLEVLTETQIIKSNFKDDTAYIEEGENFNTKTDLEKSQLYQKYCGKSNFVEV